MLWHVVKLVCNPRYEISAWCSQPTPPVPAVPISQALLCTGTSGSAEDQAGQPWKSLFCIKTKVTTLKCSILTTDSCKKNFSWVSGAGVGGTQCWSKPPSPDCIKREWGEKAETQWQYTRKTASQQSQHVPSGPKDLAMFGLAVLTSSLQKANKNIISPSCSYCWLLKLPMKAVSLLQCRMLSLSEDPEIKQGCYSFHTQAPNWKCHQTERQLSHRQKGYVRRLHKNHCWGWTPRWDKAWACC